MWKYVRNMKKYVENLNKYLAPGLGSESTHMYLSLYKKALELGKIPDSPSIQALAPL